MVKMREYGTTFYLSWTKMNMPFIGSIFFMYCTEIWESLVFFSTCRTEKNIERCSANTMKYFTNNLCRKLLKSLLADS